MSILILYETIFGFTKQCAETLHTQLQHSSIFDIHSTEYSLDDYDTVLIGAPIYEGKIEQDTSRYLIIHKNKLLQKRLGIFCAGMNTNEFNYAVQGSIHPDIFYNAEIVHCGGKINYESLSFKDKRIVKKQLGIKTSQEVHNEQKMKEFVKWVLKK